MNKEPDGGVHDDSDEEELIRSEFDAIVAGLSLDESSPSTFLDEREVIDQSDGFIAPNPTPQTPRAFLFSARRAIKKWLERGSHDDDGVHL